MFIVGDHDYYQKICRKIGLDEFEQRNYGGETFMVERGSGVMNVIWIPRLDFTATNYGAIVHELLHASFKTMEKVGFKFSYDNHEPINYYVGYLLVRVLEKLKKFYK